MELYRLSSLGTGTVRRGERKQEKQDPDYATTGDSASPGSSEKGVHRNGRR